MDIITDVIASCCCLVQTDVFRSPDCPSIVDRIEASFSFSRCPFCTFVDIPTQILRQYPWVSHDSYPSSLTSDQRLTYILEESSELLSQPPNLFESPNAYQAKRHLATIPGAMIRVTLCGILLRQRRPLIRDPDCRVLLTHRVGNCQLAGAEIRSLISLA